MAFGVVYGPPFVREGDVRRDATTEDFRNFTKLAGVVPGDGTLLAGSSASRPTRRSTAVTST